MPSDFFYPAPERQNITLVDAATLRKAEGLIESCEYCNPEAEIPFDWILDRLSVSNIRGAGERHFVILIQSVVRRNLETRYAAHVFTICEDQG